MSTSPDTTLTGTLFDPSGNPMAGTVVLTLSNLGPWPPVITGTGMFAALSITAQANGSGNFSVSFFSNGAISPSGTFYTMSVYAPGSNVPVWEAPYLISSGGSYDLSTLTPLVPLTSGGSGGWGYLGTGENGGPSSYSSLLQNYFIVPGFYDVSAFCPNTFTSLQLMFLFVFERNVTFPANMVGSVSVAGTAPTSTVVFSLQQNNVQFGTLTFSPGSPPDIAGVFATSAVTFDSGDIFTVVAQGLTDATFANLAFTLAGTT